MRAVVLLLALGLVCLHGASALKPKDFLTLKNPIDCVKQNDTVLCDDMDECTWCEGTTIGTGCYPLKAAKLLPKKYFTCDKGLEAVAVPQNDSCDKLPEDSCVAPSCVWCTSAAVGGGCYTPAQAKLLPSAIFKCKEAPAV